MILLVLIALAARVDAAPSDDAIALAVRYADILTGVERDDADADADAVRDDGDGDDDGEADDESEPGDHGESGHGGDDTGDDLDVADADGDRDDSDRGGPQGFARAALLGDDPADPAMIASDDARVPGAWAGAAETYEAWLRHRRPSRWGRLDVGLAWRRRWSEPIHALPHHLDELWLVATWRR